MVGIGEREVRKERLVVVVNVIMNNWVVRRVLELEGVDERGENFLEYGVVEEDVVWMDEGVEMSWGEELGGVEDDG